MSNLRYLINISHQPSYAIGQELTNIAGTTQSIPTYSDPFYIASMPEVRIAATGSSYEEALDNLLIAASASTGNEPLSGIRTY
jgi:hypothetical protein